MNRRIRDLVLGALLVGGLCGAAVRGSGSVDSYGVSGDVNGTPLTGCIEFEQGGSGFHAVTQTASLSTTYSGIYAEASLLFISFWSFQGVVRGGPTQAEGSGIRLFFNLLAFGSIEFNNGVTDVVTSFSGAVGACSTAGVR